MHKRLDAIDALRGLVIVLMVLDHTRDFFHVGAMVASPTDPDTTTPLLFFTRWVTHLCAPTFVLLAGVSIYFQQQRGKPLGRFLLLRGLWLIGLEMTVVALGFNFSLPFFFFQVIWAIGFGMVVMSAAHRLHIYAIAGIAFVILVGHDALSGVQSDTAIWKLLMARGELGDHAYVAYAAVPWLGVMMLGYALGPVFVHAHRRRLVAMLGASFLAAFFVLRLGNFYGDPKPWTVRATSMRTVLSFFEVSKYPPSLIYVLVTVGCALLLFLAVEHVREPLLSFGRTPLSTYVAHIYLVHGTALAVGVACGVPAHAFIDMLDDPRELIDAHWGFGLFGVYVAWLLIIAALYPLSRWFAGIKSRRKDWWLSYL